MCSSWNWNWKCLSKWFGCLLHAAHIIIRPHWHVLLSSIFLCCHFQKNKHKHVLQGKIFWLPLHHVYTYKTTKLHPINLCITMSNELCISNTRVIFQLLYPSILIPEAWHNLLITFLVPAIHRKRETNDKSIVRKCGFRFYQHYEQLKLCDHFCLE